MPFVKIDPADNAHVRDFISEVDALFDPDEPETFWKCEECFARLGATPAAAEVAEQALKHMIDAPLDAPSRWGMGRLVLVQSAAYSLVVTWTGLPRDLDDGSLITQGGHAFIQSLSSRPFTLRFFATGEVDFTRFDPRMRLEPSHEVCLQPGQTLRVDSRKWVLQLDEEPDICLLVFVSRPLWPHLWSYDMRTLHAWHIGHSELQLSQLRAVMQVFRELGYEPARAVVEGLTHHPVHDVRWDAVKTLASLDANAGVAALRHALDDPHPHVRAAANRSLARFNAHAQPATEAS